MSHQTARNEVVGDEQKQLKFLYRGFILGEGFGLYFIEYPSLDERARLLVLLAAQLHPTALGWLACASQEADPTLRGLAACGYQRARTRWMALQQGLALCAR